MPKIRPTALYKRFMKRTTNSDIIEIGRSSISGAIEAPPSKSMMVRAVFAAMLSKGKTTICRPSYCDDAMAAIDIARQFGCGIEISTGKMEITSGAIALPKEINCKESALCLSLISMIAPMIPSASANPIRIGGERTLLRRRFTHITELINSLGGKCTSNNGRLPFQIAGPIDGGIIELSDSNSSQHISGLMYALALANTDSKVLAANLKSRQYVGLTIELLSKFGIDIREINDSEFYIGGGQAFRPCRLEIGGDWSGAAFMLVAGGIGGSVSVAGLDVNSNQPDRAILKALAQAGASVLHKHGLVTVERNELNAFDFDAGDCPDLFPPLAALAVYCNGISAIRGVGRLANKESDRGAVLVDEFNAIGAEISIKDDMMNIRGGHIAGGIFNSHGDHRIAMAGAIAGLKAAGPVEIVSPGCVAKSYPEFFAGLDSISVRNDEFNKQ